MFTVFPRNEELQATLWGELALDFDAEKILQLPPPAVIVITSSKVATYASKNKCPFSRRDHTIYYFERTIVIFNGISGFSFTKKNRK